MKQQISIILNKKELYKKFIMAYWNTLQAREQKIVTYGGFFLGILFIFWLITSAIDIRQEMIANTLRISQDAIVATSISKQYKELNASNANSVNEVRIDQMRIDVASTLDNKQVDVLLQDGILSINAGDVEFAKIMILLEQLRDSYGLYPTTVNINKLSKSGHVSFHATFMVNQ